MGKYKYKLTEKPFKVGDKSVEKDVQSTVSNVDKETGSVTWDIKKLPSITTVFNKLKSLSIFLETLDRDTDDEVIDKVHQDLKGIFNRYRTHIRKNYPEAYGKVDEISVSSGAGAYLSKTATTGRKELDEEESKVEVWQQERINSFDQLEGRLLDLKKKLRQGKLSTIKHYRENPTNWSVVFGTDIIADYFNDVETLLSANKE